METKLLKRNKLAIVPAGIIEGTEAFWYNNEKWVIHQGNTFPFSEAPGNVQRLFADAFLDDKRSQEYLKSKMGIERFSEAFDMWFKCKVGGLDHEPDFMNGNFTADAFNNTCSEYTCPHRGKFCSLQNGLLSYEVETLEALKAGKSIEETAGMLFISMAGMKSRIEKIKEKLGATNMASMMVKAGELGI